jgi:transglutaminase-like putative cysteine protease
MTESQLNSLQPRDLKISLILSLLVVLPHALNVPTTLSLFFIAVLIWRFVNLAYHQLKPNRWILVLFTVIGVYLVYSQHYTLLGRDAGVSLLTAMLALKLMEIHRKRDVYAVVFINFFVIITQFLYNQSFLLAGYMLLLLVCLVALLIEINKVDRSQLLLTPLKQALFIGLQAIPIAVILFILFPRLSQPLWQFGLNTNIASTGLGDRVSPGSISQLIQSQSVAFRVRFLNRVPPEETHYWRAMVIWDTDGYEWFNEKTTSSLQARPLPKRFSHPIDYEIYPGEANKDRLFALDIPINAPVGTYLSSDHELTIKETNKRSPFYTLRSFIDYQMAASTEEGFFRALELPDNVTPDERELVRQWSQSSQSDVDIVQNALRYFNQQPFVYTLVPPLYSRNPIHEFLFEGREGFCEHYASSFVLLMRLAGIPSRLVIGYLGSEHNPVGGYYLIRQSNAHAWAEVWLDELGWVRIDPTAAVAPERVRNSIPPQAFIPGNPVLFKIDDSSLFSAALNNLKLVMDAANLGWRRWIIGYSQERQRSLLDKLGLESLKMREWGFLIIALIAITLAMTMLRLLMQNRLTKDPVVSVYLNFCRKLAKSGYPRHANEGPLDYCNRLSQLNEKMSPEVMRIFQRYIQLRYGKSRKAEEIRQFRMWVRKLRI